MPHYRVTIRHGRPQQYVIEDIEAESLAAALRAAADGIAVATEPDADLAEIRVQMDPDARRYASQ